MIKNKLFKLGLLSVITIGLLSGCGNTYVLQDGTRVENGNTEQIKMYEGNIITNNDKTIFMYITSHDKDMLNFIGDLNLEKYEIICIQTETYGYCSRVIYKLKT